MEPVGAEVDAELRREGVLQLASDLIECKEEEDAAEGDARCITGETRATQVLKASECVARYAAREAAAAAIAEWRSTHLRVAERPPYLPRSPGRWPD